MPPIHLPHCLHLDAYNSWIKRSSCQIASFELNNENSLDLSMISAVGNSITGRAISCCVRLALSCWDTCLLNNTIGMMNLVLRLHNRPACSECFMLIIWTPYIVDFLGSCGQTFGANNQLSSCYIHNNFKKGWVQIMCWWLELEVGADRTRISMFQWVETWDVSYCIPGVFFLVLVAHCFISLYKASKNTNSQTHDSLDATLVPPRWIHPLFLVGRFPKAVRAKKRCCNSRCCKLRSRIATPLLRSDRLWKAILYQSTKMSLFVKDWWSNLLAT